MLQCVLYNQHKYFPYFRIELTISHKCYMLILRDQMQFYNFQLLTRFTPSFGI